MRKLLWALGALALVAGGWWALRRPDARDFTGAMLQSVREERRLVVLSVDLSSPVDSKYTRTVFNIPYATSRVTVTLPATVDYSVDLKHMQDSDLTWDEKSATLTVRRPRVEVGKPNIGWEDARIHRDDGLLVTQSLRETADAEVRRKAPAIFRAEANALQRLEGVEKAADKEIQALFTGPLRAAGKKDAKVVVVRQGGARSPSPD